MIELYAVAEASVLVSVLQSKLATCSFGSGVLSRVKWHIDSSGLVKVEEPVMCKTFFEASGFITRVLCSLFLRTFSKENAFAWTGQTSFGGSAGFYAC